ncbi:helix-turn-helix domain-containing protein [Aquimarina sp. SS2-1]|uniref:helix-turn-helix domain-containing protein n=1 Tax=Aquimarina besae TaxID=3342247 RepID=UPI00366F40D3
MVIEEFKPKSDLLKKYINSFYFIKSKDNKRTEFIYYPHFIETINIFSDSSVNISDNVFNVEKEQNKNTVILSAAKTKFRTALINNAYDIIGIQFFPLAIHNFFDVKMLSMIEVGLFGFGNSKEFNKVSLTKGIENRIDALESFFQNTYKNRDSKLDKLSRIIKLIHKSKGNIRMNELENQVSLSRRTILRQFKKYLFCSFEDYKNTVRFRLAIQNFSGQNRNTSDLIADIAYYDQSDFINHFKTLAGESPKKLLKYIANNPDTTSYFWKLKQIIE